MKIWNQKSETKTVLYLTGNDAKKAIRHGRRRKTRIKISKWSIKSIDQSIDQAINRPTDQSLDLVLHIDLSTEINQSINQSVNQSINRGDQMGLKWRLVHRSRHKIIHRSSIQLMQGQGTKSIQHTTVSLTPQILKQEGCKPWTVTTLQAQQTTTRSLKMALTVWPG